MHPATSTGSDPIGTVRIGRRGGGVPSRERIAVAMSGGVDSTTVAALLREQGHDVVGVTMRLRGFVVDDGQVRRDETAVERTIGAAREAARALDVPHHVLDLADAFEERVVRPFAAEYLRGRTPNACVRCNAVMKFDALWDAARDLGATAFATGHYARLEPNTPEGPVLRRGAHAAKEQSYFLFGVPTATLRHTRFPLGEWTKDDVRAYAAARGLVPAERGESQENCFLPDGSVATVAAALGDLPVPPPGAIVDRDGHVRGRHRGLHHYTVGQRRGLGIAAPAPLYVCALEPSADRLVVGPREACEVTELVATDARWVAGTAPDSPLRADVQIRYRHGAAAATVEVAPDGRSFRAHFDSPVFAVAPGQAAVVYLGDRVVGGGWITVDGGEG